MENNGCCGSEATAEPVAVLVCEAVRMADHPFISHLLILGIFSISLPLFLPTPEVSGDSDPCHGAPPFLPDAGEKEGGSSPPPPPLPPPPRPQRPIARLLLLLLRTAAAQYQTPEQLGGCPLQNLVRPRASGRSRPASLLGQPQRSSLRLHPPPEHGRVSSGPALRPAPGASPGAQPGAGSCPGRLPGVLQVLLRHDPVSGAPRHQRRPDAVGPGERERDGNVSVTDACCVRVVVLV